MYLSYFGLTEAPFSIAPDPRYLYMSQRHQEALAHLLYGVTGEGGFVLLTGEVGAGKTTVCRCLLEQIPESCDVAYIFNPKLTVEELLSTICAEFRIACPPGNTSIKVFVDHINEHLLDAHARGRHAVLIIDEAQNLSADVLEQMRLLTNLETNERKLLQIILIGQPELADMLARPELRQLAQRIVARYHLGPLSRQEVAAYVEHRLQVAGTQRQLFPAALISRLHRLSGGVPRVINVLCDRALLGAYAQSRDRVDRATLKQAAREVFPQSARPGNRLGRAFAAGLVLLAGGAAAVLLYQQGQPRPAAPPAMSSNAKTKTADHAARVPAGQALPAVLEWPSDQPRSQSEALAYAAVFRAWGVDVQGADACRQAQGQGFRCRTARGGLDDLRELNRPAVLRLRDDQGHEFYAALTRLGPVSATFTVGTATRRVALGALAAQWTGDYSLPWRAPAVVQGTLRPGDKGPAVGWVIDHVARVQGRQPAANADPVYDDDLTRQVKRFQLSHGLVPDGDVGPRTLIRLVSETDDAAPRLVAKPTAKGKGN